jgi:arabinogalactan endo-1,4-beta-galactosidase
MRKPVVGLVIAIVGLGWVLGERESASSAPVLLNPSFEADGGVASPTGWQSSGSADADYTEFGGHTGNWRLSHYSANAHSVDTTQTLRGLSPGWYTMKAWARRSTGNNNAYIALDCGGDVERTYVPVAWPDQWLQIVVSARTNHRGACTVTLHSDGDGGEWSNFDDVELVSGEAPKLAVVGADVSSLNKSIDFGGEYLDDHGHGKHGRHGHQSIASALNILKEHGLEYVRLRVWVNPADGYHDKRDLLEVARQADRLGMKVLVDLHYSDTWADPSHQTKPAAWAGYTVEQLRKAVHDHAYDICRSMRAQGTPPAIVQIGNELNAGMLWPDGHTYAPPNWPNLASFLTAGHDAIKACSPRTKVMLHLGNGGDNGLYTWWFDNVTSLGVPFDIIGASYYGYWHGSMGDLQYNLNSVSSRYNKPVMVVETAYPFTLDDPDGFPNSIGFPSQLVAGYPATPDGQARNLRDVMSIVRAVPNGLGMGVMYWDATWTAVPGNGWDPTDPSSGNNWENQALFDFDDRPVPAMSVFPKDSNDCSDH